MTRTSKLFAAVAPLLFWLACANHSAQPSGAQLMEKHAAALGGRDRLGAVHSRHIESSLVQADGKPIGTFSTYSKDGHRLLTELHAGSSPTTVVYDGSKGYARDAKGIAALTAKASEHAMIASHIDVVEACRVAAASCTPTVKGIRNVADRRCFLLSLQWKESGLVDAYLDAADFRLVQTVSSVDTGAGPLEIVTHFRNFQPHNGLVLPYTQSVAGKYGEYLIQVRSYDINPELGDGLFDASPSNPALIAQAAR
jgi:hypothetical protein